MESRNEHNLWQRTSQRVFYPPLEGNLEVDTAVIGGGITGLTTALLLAQSGQRVAVLEAMYVGGGVTGYTSAHLTAAFDTGYSTIAAKFGREGARLFAESQQTAIDQIEALALRLRIDCDFQRVPAYLYSEDESREIEQEAMAAKRAGLHVSLVDQIPLPFSVEKAARFENQARFHPLQYLGGLARGLTAQGGQIFEQTRCLDIRNGKTPVVVTDRGEVRCRNVVIATHSPLNKVFLHTKIAPYRSYILVARVEEEIGDALFFDTDDPYHYTRRFTDEDGSYLIVGGADHKVGHQRDTNECFHQLERYVEERYEVTEFADRWSAQVFEPVDGIPFIGRNSLAENIFVATGYSGNGLTSGTVAGMLLSDLILKGSHPWAELYSATRVKPLAAAKEFMRENVDFPLHLATDWFRPGEVQSTIEIPPGEGRLMREGKERLAVFRAESGELSACSAVCTHMGCHVQWNTAEKSWDCPCHGSRFTAHGEVIDGPAVRALPLRDVPGEKGREDELPPSEPPAAPM